MSAMARVVSLMAVLMLSIEAHAFSLDDVFGGKKKKDVPAWAKEPLLTAKKCDNLSWKNIASFIDKYNAPVDIKDTLDAAGKKANGGYILAASVINRSMICTAESLDMKDTVKQLNLERDILLSGTSLSEEQMARHRAYSDQANKEINARLAETKKIEPAQKKTMALSFGMFFTGSYLTYELKEKLEKYQKEVRNKTSAAKKTYESGDVLGGVANMLTGAGAGYNLYTLASALPEHITTLVSTGSELRSFAKSNKVDVPKDATRYYMQTNGEAW